MKYLTALLLAMLGLWQLPAYAACTDGDNDGRNGSRVEVGARHILYTGSCTEDNEILIQTDSLTGYDWCYLMSSTGAVDIFFTLDGTNYSTAALSMEDKGATDGTDAVVSVAGRGYAFPVKFRGLRVTQNGATDAAAALMCARYGA